MKRLRRLSDFWNWLPAFRAVAESEHLPTAARQLHVSASALSRAIHLLEESLGVSLFEREGRRIVLNDAGRELLDSVRRSMRTLDDGIESVTEQTFKGTVRFAAPDSWAALFLVPAISQLKKVHPGLTFELVNVPQVGLNAALLAGVIDVALVDDPIPSSRVQISKLTELKYGLYCGAGHPLWAARRVSAEAVLAHPFVTATEGQTDHWPTHLRRQVGCRVAEVHLQVQLCATGCFLALLPESVVSVWQGPGSLKALAFEATPNVGLYAVQREVVSNSKLLEVVLQAIAQEVKARPHAS